MRKNCYVDSEVRIQISYMSQGHGESRSGMQHGLLVSYLVPCWLHSLRQDILFL